ncbi:MAG: class I SAM-dependent methyltransferase [Acidobacteria bacterium]|nr:class I SAM-dependent methyltransferase [Acidobacteriota bacterium]
MPPVRTTNPTRTCEYYQHIHEQNEAYQTNNWLLDELERIDAFGATTVLELACGNGRFLDRAAARFTHVYGCDWAVSPLVAPVLAAHANVTFFRTDLYRESPPCHADLVVSADFLEHISPDAIDEVLRRIDTLGPSAFHKIACYDDGHSHLTILSPDEWLVRLHAIDADYRLERVEDRHGDPTRQIAVFSRG